MQDGRPFLTSTRLGSSDPAGTCNAKYISTLCADTQAGRQQDGKVVQYWCIKKPGIKIPGCIGP
jgi:hypothetical protein